MKGVKGDLPGIHSHNWRGGVHIDHRGYVRIHKPEHPRSHNGYLLEHIIVAEKTLGKFLPKGVVVHHIDENKTNNTPSNLVICQNDSYHKLLHRRMKALKASGHASWVRCEYCGIHDDPNKLYLRNNRNIGYHNYCANRYLQERRRKFGRKRKSQ